MPVRRIKGWWYTDFYVESRRYRKRSPENSRAGAQAYELVLRQRLARGEDIEHKPVAEKPLSFAEFAREWFETYVKANNKPSEQRNKRIALDRHLLPLFGSTSVRDITEMQIEVFKRDQKRVGLCNKSINNHLAILGRALRCAKAWKVVDELPTITPLKYSLKPVVALSDDESARLLRDTAEPTWHAMILVALRTGLRIGELFGLRWSDVDVTNHVLVVGQSIVRGVASTPKSGRARFVPLDTEVEETLAALRGDRASLIFHRADGTPLSYRIAERALHRACRRAGVRPIGWHALRHTVGTQLHKSRVPMRDIQSILGHSSLAMTERYTHVLMDDMRAGIATLAARQAPIIPERGQPLGNERVRERVTPCAASQNSAS